jgi:hypothetical protein
MRKEETIMGERILKFVSVLSLLNILLYGCASYKPTPLPTLQPEFATYSETIDNVTLACKTLSKGECKRYFDRDIIGKGYQPIQVTVNNDTKRYMLFSPQGVSLLVCSPEEVAEKCRTSTAGRATAYGVGALLFWPLLIPAVVDGVGSSQANTKLDRDFNEKNMEQMVINPYSTHNGVIFISNTDYQESFNVRLVDKETREKFEYHVRGLQGHFSEDKPSEINSASSEK